MCLQKEEQSTNMTFVTDIKFLVPSIYLRNEEFHQLWLL